MGQLQRALHEQVRLLPEKALAEILHKKLKDAGVRAYRRQSEELASAIINNSATNFAWDGIKKDIEIHFDESDYQEIEKISERYAETIGDVVTNLCNVFSKRFSETFEQSWRENRYKDNRDVRGFRDRIEDRWGDSLDYLRMLVEFSMVVGNNYHEQLSRSRAKKNKNLRAALSCLHIRACQVSNEMLILLENGYPDGAMARWRTLHEIVTTAFLINDGGDDVAVRYLSYDVVETKKALDELARHRAVMGLKGPSARQLKAADTELGKAVKLFGKEFANSYGWAAKFLNNRAPRFVDIQKAVGASMMQFDFKIASLNVHATPKALNARIGSLRKSSTLISGATNAGLNTPGESLAITLPKITSLLAEPTTSIDHTINLKMAKMFQEKAIKALITAEKSLIKDDAAIRNALGHSDQIFEVVW